jgi:hypothetical protein
MLERKCECEAEFTTITLSWKDCLPAKSSSIFEPGGKTISNQSIGQSHSWLLSRLVNEE